jgi:hypothetical protein
MCFWLKLTRCPGRIVGSVGNWIRIRKMIPRPAREFGIRPMEPVDRPAIVEIARSLTQFFPEDVVDLISDSLNKKPVLVGVLGEEVIGFQGYASSSPPPSHTRSNTNPSRRCGPSTTTVVSPRSAFKTTTTTTAWTV